MCNWKPLANEKLVLSNGVKLEIQTTLKSSMSINRRATHTELKNIFEGSLTHNILSVFLILQVLCLYFMSPSFVLWCEPLCVWTCGSASICVSCGVFVCFLLFIFCLFHSIPVSLFLFYFSSSFSSSFSPSPSSFNYYYYNYYYYCYVV